MKNISIYFLVICTSFFSTQCKEENNMNNDLSYSQVTLSVKSGEVVIHPIANAMPIEGGYRITQQAKNYKISEIKYGGEQAAIAYHYQSKPGFKGTETVEITSSYSIGDANQIDNGVIVLTIQVN